MRNPEEDQNLTDVAVRRAAPRASRVSAAAKQTFFKQLDISSCQDLKPEQELSKILENQPEYTESKAW